MNLTGQELALCGQGQRLEVAHGWLLADKMVGPETRYAAMAANVRRSAHGKGGSVTNISSMASVGAFTGGSVYSGTKAAIDSFTRTPAAELGPKKILVNWVLPGPVETEGARAMGGFDALTAQMVPRTPPGRVGQPHDSRRWYRFWCSTTRPGSPGK